MMDSTTTVALAAVVVGLAIWAWRQGRPSYYPPGPLCLPIFGSVFSMTIEPLHFQLNAWRKQYGDIFSFSLGSDHIIVLNGYDTIKEALVNNSVAFAGRADASDIRIQGYTTNFPILGIGDSTHSEEWTRQRATAVKIMRTLGYGKSRLEGQIRQEAIALQHVLAATEAKPTNPSSLIRTSIVNVSCSLLYGERYEYGDPEFKQLEKNIGDIINGFFKDLDGDYIWLFRLKPSYHTTLKELYEAYAGLNRFNEAKFKERRERLEDKGYSQPTDFIEHYICEQRNAHGGSKLTQNRLSGIVNDIIIAGAETATSTLNWIFIWMAARPDVQEKVYQEVNLATEGDTSAVSTAIRDQCPYTEATMMEVMRITPILPFAIKHCATQDIKFQGYFIPKDSLIFVNLYSVLSDPEVWTEPDLFKPDRHIENGRLVHAQKFVCFSMGRRSCLGETLARQQIFILFATIVSSFKIRLQDGQKANLDPWDRGVMKPHPYEVIFEPRE